MLYVVATPIGNLGDISHRALETLEKVSLIAAEDTRVTQKLLNHFAIRTQCLSCHEHNESSVGKRIVERMLKENIDVALVTDAGTPSVSDPGAILVREAAACGIEVVPVPGPSAAAAALSVSGVVGTEYTFFGFLPRAKKDCVAKLKTMAGAVQTAILYESPYRVVALLENIAAVYPGAYVSLSCDLTKFYEKTLRGPIEEVLLAVLANEKAEKGEYCAVLDLSPFEAFEKPAVVAASLEARLFEQLLEGSTLREAREALVKAGENKNRVYAAALRISKMLEGQS